MVLHRDLYLPLGRRGLSRLHWDGNRCFSGLPLLPTLLQQADIQTKMVLSHLDLLGPICLNEPCANHTKITALALDCDSSVQLDISKTMNIPILVEATDAKTDEIRFLTSDESVISFYRLSGDDNGLMGCITPVSEGTAYITVSNGDITSNKVHVTVIDSARIAEEEAARIAAEEEAARIAAEEEAALYRC